MKKWERAYPVIAAHSTSTPSGVSGLIINGENRVLHYQKHQHFSDIMEGVDANIA